MCVGGNGYFCNVCNSQIKNVLICCFVVVGFFILPVFKYYIKMFLLFKYFTKTINHILIVLNHCGYMLISCLLINFPVSNMPCIYKNEPTTKWILCRSISDNKA